MEKTNDFTEGKILPKLIGFAFPVLLALFLQAMYGAVDLLVVGQFSSAAAVSAVSTGSQIQQSVTTVITGIAMGITVLVGQKIGEKHPCLPSSHRISVPENRAARRKLCSVELQHRSSPVSVLAIFRSFMET